jgi:RND family efflux transporter MFP subunit
VTAAVSGVVTEVRHHEGDSVAAGEVIAVLDDSSYRSALAKTRSELEIAEGEAARYRAEGNAADLSAALSRRDAAQARIALAQENLDKTRVSAPAAGVVVTPHLENRIGQFVTSGSELAVLADTGATVAEIAVPESEVSRVAAGESVSLKVNAYPTRIFHGSVTRLGAEVRQEGEERFLVAEAKIESGRDLRAGMLGKAKVSAGRRQLITLMLRGPIRFIWARLWPLLP